MFEKNGLNCVRVMYIDLTVITVSHRCCTEECETGICTCRLIGFEQIVVLCNFLLSYGVLLAVSCHLVHIVL